MCCSQVAGLASIVGAITLSTSTLHAHWALPEHVPVDRLVQNVERYVDEHPDEAAGHYTLGRVHSLAFALRTNSLGTYGSKNEDELPQISGRSFQDDAAMYRQLAIEHPEYFGDDEDAMARFLENQKQLLDHLEQALEHLRAAIEIDSEPAHYHLSLAYTLARGRHLASYVDSAAGLEPSGQELTLAQRDKLELMILQLSGSKLGKRGEENTNVDELMSDLRSNLKAAIPLLLMYRADVDWRRQERVATLLEEFWTLEALDAYYEAFRRAYPENKKISVQPMRGLSSLVSYEAGESFLRLVNQRAAWVSKYENEIKEIEAGLKVLDSKPENNAITPIIVAMDDSDSINELLAEGLTVEFDLDGDGDEERWSWLKPTTALLVWDPTGSGTIANGRQLFGSATWWMFFGNGYQALDALDDNRDGWLTGDELAGLALWFDRNSDGRSDAKEVVPIEESEIDALATRSTGREGPHPLNRRGVRLRDGRTVPSYDWVTSPVEE